jgi:hypothetical protein
MAQSPVPTPTDTDFNDDALAGDAATTGGLPAEGQTEGWAAGLEPDECLEFAMHVILTALDLPRGELSEDEHRNRLNAVIGTALEGLPSDAMLFGVVEGLSLTEYADTFWWAVDRDLEAKIRRARANCFEARAEQLDRVGDHQSANEVRAMAGANRRAAHAIKTKLDPSVEVRESRRTTRMALNRRRRDFGLRPLPVPPPLRLRLRQARPRARGHRPVHQHGSRRCTAPSRGDPDPDGDSDASGVSTPPAGSETAETPALFGGWR